MKFCFKVVRWKGRKIIKMAGTFPLYMTNSQDHDFSIPVDFVQKVVFGCCCAEEWISKYHLAGDKCWKAMVRNVDEIE